MAQLQFAIMEWLDDGRKLSIHHLKHIVEPKKGWNDYVPGDEGKAKYPGADGLWNFKIHRVGSTRKELNSPMADIIKEREEAGMSNNYAFGVINSTTKRSDILKAMRSKLTSYRTKKKLTEIKKRENSC